MKAGLGCELCQLVISLQKIQTDNRVLIVQRFNLLAIAQLHTAVLQN